MKRALITGITSQDGSYLAEILLEKGYEVFGLVRRSATPNFWRIEKILQRVTLISGDLTDGTSLSRALLICKPDEVYNLAAQSFVKYSFEVPESTAEITGLGVLKLLEAVKNYALDFNQEIRMFQASSSEMFGKIQETPQTETTRFYPRSVYGASKAFAHHLCVNYREAYGLKVSCGIMFNHESPRRGEEFVTRKISKGIAEVKCGLLEKVKLGNLNAVRDWGHARDYMHGAWLMLQREIPDDYVLATNEVHSVKQWLEKTCEYAGINYWDAYLQDATFERQAEVDYLRGNSDKAKKELGWVPTVGFDDLVKEMYEADYERASKALAGHRG